MVAGVVPVLVASGSPALAQGLADFLSDPPLAPVVVHSIEGARACAVACRPRVAVIDPALADGPGAILAAELAAILPAIPVLTVVDAPGFVAPLATPRGAATGSVSVRWTRDALVQAVIEAVRAGGDLDAATERLLGGSGVTAELTDQERVVLRLMRQHLTYKEIALQMGLSWHTVRTHAQSVLRKTGVHSRRDLRFADGGPAGATAVP